MLQKPIIEIKRASEQFVQLFIDSGFLEVTEKGIKVADNRKVLPPASIQD